MSLSLRVGFLIFNSIPCGERQDLLCEHDFATECIETLKKQNLRVFVRELHIWILENSKESFIETFLLKIFS